MTNVYKIDQERRRIRGRQYRLVDRFQDDQFHCSICGNLGQKGYILQNTNNEQEELRIGETCIRENFIIFPDVVDS